MASSEKRRLKRRAAAAGLGSTTIGIVGDGAFAAALAGLAASADQTVVLCVRDAERRKELHSTRVHPRLPMVRLGPKVMVSGDVGEMAGLAELIVLAVSTTSLAAAVAELARVVTNSHIVAHAIGGLAPGERRVSEYLLAELESKRVAVLGGPVLPAELAYRRTSALVAAAADPAITQRIKDSLEIAPLRLYRSEDVAGVELASATAGAITVLAGLCDGLGIGNSPRAVVITRALGEAARIGETSGAPATAFYGMAGLGAILLRTSPGSSAHSTDYQLGLALGREEVPAEWQTEGVRVLEALVRVASLLNLRAPILTTVFQAVSREISLDEAQDRVLSITTDME